MTDTKKPSITRRHFTGGIAAGAALLSMPAVVRTAMAQTGKEPLKIGMLLPKSGVQAGLGQACQRGADVAQAVLDDLNYGVKIELLNADTESSVDTARTQAEKLLNGGASVLIGAFDSGQSSAIAQVAEQKGIPYVINIAAAPDITEQGYKFVFRNFPTAGMILGDAFTNQLEIFALVNDQPKTAVMLHVNDTYGMSILGGTKAMFP